MRILLRPINLLLLAGPLGFLSLDQRWGAIPSFVLLALAIIPLSGLTSGFTDAIADQTGSQVGGLLEAIFGNAAFIILGFLALSQGLVTVVQASIAGAVISNTLLVLGTSFFFGALSGRRQLFKAVTGQNYSKLLALTVVALVLPAVAEQSVPGENNVGFEVSAITAVVLIVLYLVYVLFDVFHLRDYGYHLDEEHERATTAIGARTGHQSERDIPVALAIPGLIGALIGTFYVSQTLITVTVTVTRGTEPLTIGGYSLGTLALSETFVGLVVIPLIGSVAEHLNAIRSSMKGDTETTIANTAGSAIQIALLAAPIFVLYSFFSGGSGPKFALLFTRLELAVFALAAFLFYLVTEDGEGTWQEGAQLMGFYAIFAGAAFFLK